MLSSINNEGVCQLQQPKPESTYQKQPLERYPTKQNSNSEKRRKGNDRETTIETKGKSEGICIVTS